MRKYTMFKQVCNLIPPHFVNRLAKDHGVDEKSRTFSPWSHVVAHIYAHMTHAISLNDVCDALRMNPWPLIGKSVGQPHVVMPKADPPAEKEVLGIYINHKNRN